MAATGPQEVSTAAITTDGKPGITAINSNTNKEQNYKLYYIGESKSAVVLPVDNQTPPKPIIGGKSIYTNGVWDTTQFSGINESDQSSIHSKIQTEIRNHTTTTNQVVPQWADTNSQGFEVTSTQNQVAVETENNKAGGGFFQPFYNAWEGVSTWTGNFVDGTKRNFELGIQVWKDGPAALVFNAGVQGGAYDNDNDLKLNKRVITYPSDLSNQQDVMKIECYSYQPPYEASMAQSFGKGNTDTNLGYGLSRQTPYRKKLGAGIILPVPNNVSDANSTSWVDDNMSTMSMGAAQHVNATIKGKAVTLGLGYAFGMGGAAEGFNRLTGNAALYGTIGTKQAGQGELGANLISQLTGKLGFDVTPETILSRAGGVIANANTELMFSGVKLRQFGFQWRMTPRDEMEAHQIRMIIRAFKQWSAPRKITKLHSGEKEGGTVGRAGSPSYFLGTPNIFRLRYMTAGGKSILGLNKFKPCALTSIQVQYTPDGQWNAYEGGQPISVIMDLRFAELEPIYNTDYSNSIAENRAFDPSDPNSLGDLMPISIIEQNNPASSDVGY